MISSVDACASEPAGLEVAVDDEIVVLTVRGHLGAAVGDAVTAATEGAVHQQARRLDIDLRQVSSFTAGGAAALRACRSRAAGLREGLHYRTGRGPGRDALLAAYSPAAAIESGLQPGM
ncbi:hypothetical protein BH24ACT1_BH24ACT1_04400 [soil metagenome]